MVAGRWSSESIYSLMQSRYNEIVGKASTKKLSDEDLLHLWNDRDSIMGSNIQSDGFPVKKYPMTKQSSSFPFLKKVADDPSESNWLSLIDAVRKEYGKNFYARADRFISIFNNDLFNIYSPTQMNRFLDLLVAEKILSQRSFLKKDSWFKKSRLVMKVILSNIQIPATITGIERNYRLKTFSWMIVESVLMR